MKNFRDYRKIKKEYGSINEQQFMADAVPGIELELVGPNDAPINIDTKIPLEVKTADELDVPENPNCQTVDAEITKLLNFLPQIRVLHWNTLEYPEHMATGATYEAYDDALDTFVETYQGYYPRVKFVDALHLRNKEEIVVTEWLTEIDKSISTIRGLVSQTDLQNILDELSGLVGKFRYLSTLK